MNYQPPRQSLSEYLGIGTWPSAMDCEIEFECKCGVKVRTRSRIKAKHGRCDECQAKVVKARNIKSGQERRAKARAGK